MYHCDRYEVENHSQFAPSLTLPQGEGTSKFEAISSFPWLSLSRFLAGGKGGFSDPRRRIRKGLKTQATIKRQ
jgi:hypothetical protein